MTLEHGLRLLKITFSNMEDISQTLYIYKTKERHKSGHGHINCWRQKLDGLL